MQTVPGKGGSSPRNNYPNNFVRSQEHLLQTTEYNPSPTMMPPPSTGLAGAIGERHVICFVGLPARGKQFMAERLCRYLKFFHGAQCKIFDLAIPELSTDEAVGDALGTYLEEEDETATTQLLRSLEGIEDDSLDRLKKNVDSGKIAIIDTSDAFKTQRRAWAGTSKETRWAMQKHLASLRVRVKLLFIEVIVTETSLVRRFLRQRLSVGPPDDSRDNKDSSTILEAKVDAAEARIAEFGRSFVTIQDDGSEDDLAYVKLINYGDKVVTNKIRGFLLMQIVKYLSHVHPNPRMVYLCRHGQSQYNICQKIGGNPGITASGERFAKWLGKWVPANVWTANTSEQIDGKPRDPPKPGSVLSGIHNSTVIIPRPVGGLGSPRRAIEEEDQDGDGLCLEAELEKEAEGVKNTTLLPSKTLEKKKPKSIHESATTAKSSSTSNTKALAVAGANDIIGANLLPDDEAVDPNTGRPLFGRIYEVYDTQTKTSRPAIIRPTRLWTSTLKRTIDTARHIPHPVLELRGGGVWQQMLPRVYRNLDEIFAGDYEGMTYTEIEQNFGEESILRKKDKLGYRYPRGESYLDLIARLDPLMHELESYTEPLLVVSHQATLRIIYAYLVGLPRADAPKIDVPLHTVIRLSWDGWQTFEETRFAFDENDFAQVSQNDGQQFL